MLNPDRWLFQKINMAWTAPWADSFFPWYTNVQRTWAFLWIFLPVLLLALYWHRGLKGFFTLALGALATWGADELNAQFVKTLFARPRPFAAGFDMILRVPKPGGSSFPSGHAVDAFFFATFLAFYFPRLRFIFLGLAVLTAYSRVYCGVHYPGDVIAGAVIGTLLARCLLAVFHRAPFIRGLK